MVSGTDEHGTPVMVAADREGKTYAEVADHYNRSFREDFAAARALLRPLLADDDAQPRARHPGPVPRPSTRTARSSSARCSSPSRRTTGHTLPGPLHRGHLPDLRLPRGARRPVRQLRQPARPDRPDRAALAASTAACPSSARRSTSSSTCRSSPSGCATGSPSHEDWRPNVRNFSLALLDEIRPRPITRDLDWGVRIPVPGYAEDDAQADLRLVRRRDRLPLGLDRVGGGESATRTPGGSWWQNPDAEHHYFQGKDNIVFHTVIWPAMLLGYGEGGEYGAGRGPLELPTNVVATEFLTMEGKQFSTSRGYAIYLRDFLDRYERRRAPLLPRRRRARRPRTPTSPGPSSSAARTTSCSRTGATSSTATSTNAYRSFGGRARAAARSPSADEALLATIAAGFDEVGAPDRARPLPRRARRGDAPLLRGQPVRQRARRPGLLVKTDRERAATVLYVALRARRQPQGALHALPARTPRSACTSCSATTAGSPGRSSSATVAEEDGRSHEVLTGDYASWVGRWAAERARRRASALREPAPLFRKLDASIVEDELGRA